MLHLMVAARVRLAPVSGMLLVALAVAGCITPIVKYGGETEGETGTGLMSSRALAEFLCDRVEVRVGLFSAVPSFSAGMNARCGRGSSPRNGTRFEHRCFRSALSGLRAVLHSEREPVGHQDSQ
jgi:hypothetical protein